MLTPLRKKKNGGAVCIAGDLDGTSDRDPGSAQREAHVTGWMASHLSGVSPPHNSCSVYQVTLSAFWLRLDGRLSLLCAGHQGTFERRRFFGGSPLAYLCAGRHLAASAVAEGSTSAALSGEVGGGPRAASRLRRV